MRSTIRSLAPKRIPAQQPAFNRRSANQRLLSESSLSLDVNGRQMSFVFSPVLRLSSPHGDEVVDVCVQSKTNQIAFVSASSISVWSCLGPDPQLLSTIPFRPPHRFIRCAFVDESTLAVLTTMNKICLVDLRSLSFSSRLLEIPKLSKVVFFKRVAKHMFVLDETGLILYIAADLSRCQSRKVDLNANVVQARASGDSLFVLLENGQIGVMHMNDFEYLPLPTCETFVVDHAAEYIQVRVKGHEWQLWCLKPLTFVSATSLEADLAVWSPIRQTCVFFEGDTLNVSHYSDVLEKVVIGSSAAISCATFDSLGQSLLIAAGSEVYHIGFATAASIYSSSYSAPLSAKAVLLPFRDNLSGVPLPHNVRAKMALFGESALAVATDRGILILPFGEKISPAVSDGSAHAQFVKNSALAQGSQNWVKLDGYTVRDLAWYSTTLVALCVDKTYVINVISVSQTGANLEQTFPLKGKPRSISVYGNKLLISFASCLSFYSLENGIQLLSRSSFGKIGIRRAVFLNSETTVVHTTDRQLMLVFHSKVLHVIDDVNGFQLTGSSAWPLFLYGDKWRLLGVNNAELVLDDDMKRGLMIGVDGFSLFFLAPFGFTDFVHLVVFQALTTDSLASAVSILSQSSEEKRLTILTKVGIMSAESCFTKFMGLLDRFADIEDNVLCNIFQTTRVETDYREFLHTCFAHGWYRAASELLDEVDSGSCVDLLIKSGFDIYVVRKATEKFADLISPKGEVITADDTVMAKLDGEFEDFCRAKFLRHEYTVIAELLPFLEDGIKRFLMRARRERTQNLAKFGTVIKAMRKCTRQQLIELSLVFEDVLALDLVFCCSYCLNDFSKCIECIERQQRIMKFIDTRHLVAIGYCVKNVK